MTRFARAKGSKSSNERVPDEATPWSVMKMHLQDSQAASVSSKEKPKTAKQLLEEKDEPYYHDAGNVNHEWATFDDVTEKKTKNDKGAKLHTTKNNKKDKKKIKKAAELLVSNEVSNNEQILENVTNNKHNSHTVDEEIKTSSDKLESKSKKKEKTKVKKEKVDTDSEKIIECNGTEEKNVKNADIKMLENESCDKKENLTDSTVKEHSEKLSKRQKRNQKKQKKIMSETNTVGTEVIKQDVQKKSNLQDFDVQGNEWSNEVKFGKQVNPHQVSVNTGSEDDNRNESNEDNEKKEKLNKKKLSLEVQNRDNKDQSENSIPSELKPLKNNTQDKKRKGNKNEKKEYKRRKPDVGVIKMIFNGIEVEVVKYDGFPVKKEDAQRLEELKKNMIIKGIPRSEINIAMKLERRKAEKALARERKRVCFHCRKSGHNLSDCPELGRDEAATGICFKCGSTEHTHFECKVIKGQEFRHASCFICREQGHIAKQCPDNPKGLYPQGGSCKICGDVTHLKKDCPDLIKEKEETNITADKITNNQLESLQEDRTSVKNENSDNKIRSKIVKF